MKNISLGLIFTFILLPQISFGAPVVSPQQAACTQKLDAQAVAFFQTQGQERGTFIKANQTLIAKQDRIGKWRMAHGRDSQAPDVLTPEESTTLSSLTAQQQAEKAAFFKQQAIDMQNCLGGTTPLGA